MVLPTSPGDAPGETPIILAASDLGSVIVLPTSAGDTPGGTPMAFIASERGTVNRGLACSGMGSAPIASGWIVVAVCARSARANEAPTTPPPALGTGGVMVVSCVTFASGGVEGITNTFTLRVPFGPRRNA